jgi:hypothetical protein
MLVQVTDDLRRADTAATLPPAYPSVQAAVPSVSGPERPDQLLLAVVAEAGLDHGPVERLDGLDHPVGGGRTGEHEHRRPALLELLADLLDGVVVDADVGQLAGQGARGRPGPGQADGLTPSG